MARRILASLAAVAALALAGCASTPKADVVYEPNYDGIYRLAYSTDGGALYYRFYQGGIVVSARSDAPASDVLATLTLENANTSRGNWRASAGELRVGVDEGTVSYESRFDIRTDGRIALRGLPRSFEFLRTDGAGNVVATNR